MGIIFDGWVSKVISWKGGLFDGAWGCGDCFDNGPVVARCGS